VEVKRNFELDIVNLLKKGLNPSKIAVHLNISLPNLSYYLSSLKKQNVIKKIGYGTWEVIPSGEVKILSHKGSSQLKEVRGHAFIWKIKSNKHFNWIGILNEKKIDYVPKGIRQTPRIILNNKKVWLGENYITIFEPKLNSYFAVNPVEAKKEAIFSLLNTIKLIQEITGDFKYKFTCKRQHYGFVNNKEAMFFERKGQRILIKNEKGYWFSIDYSQNLYKEAETIHSKDADIDGLGYQGLMNSHEKTNFKVTPDFILQGFQSLTQASKENNDLVKGLPLVINDLKKQIKSHLHLIQEYRKENKLWRKAKEKEFKLNNQSKLNKWM
jgi:DNA-binding transcriptional ArsR family regulator